MCLSCGCDRPDDDHGDERNITRKDIEAAAKAGEVGSAADVVKNIQRGFQMAPAGQGANAQRKM